jgi:HTH-type transcriptional regulator/antitoxin HipB
MHVRTSRDLGALIRSTRRRRGWTQAQLADRAGTTRAWIIGAEQGKSSIDLGLVLRTLAALDLVAAVVPAPSSPGGVDLDALLGDDHG